MQELGIKGLSIAVIEDYKIAWAKAYGWADSLDGRAVTTETRFQAASISKSLNSLGVLWLVEQGRLDPEADINQYLKSWQFPYDMSITDQKINTYQLLSHTAGLNVHGFPGYQITDTLPTLVQVLDGQKPANTEAVRQIMAPGKEFQYSGGGTSITQLMVQDITGTDYASFMEENVLKPLGMNNSSFRQPPTDTSELATGYYSSGLPVLGGYHVYPEQAAAGLWTTPTDIAKYIIECQLTLAGKSGKVLSKAMMQRRMTPQVDSSVGLGLFIVRADSLTFFSHNGGNEAFLCTSYGTMTGGSGVVIMINGDNFTIISELLNSVAQVYNWKGLYKPEFRNLVNLPADSLDQFIGKYPVPGDNVEIQIFRDGASLYAKESERQPQPFQLLAGTGDRFYIRDRPDVVLQAQRDEAGRVYAFRLRVGDTNLLLIRQ